MSKFDVSSFSVTGDIYIYIYFQTSHFADFEEFKVDINLLTLGKFKLTLFSTFY